MEPGREQYQLWQVLIAMVRRDRQTIYFDGQFPPQFVDQFLTCVDAALADSYTELHLNFTKTSAAWPDSMIPVITVSDWLKRNDGSVSITLPRERAMKRLFLNTSWAHYIDPVHFTASAVNVDHFNVRRFKTASEQHRLVNEVMRLVVAKLTPPKEVLTGIEWSLNEITDNVLVHANAADGGLMQVTSTNSALILTVGDAGRGILASLKEGHPELRNDEQAIGQAVKAGVTRDPKLGQGNGLAGALRVSTFSGGAFQISSYRGRLAVKGANASHNLRPHTAKFPGTLVTASIGTQGRLDLEKALEFQSGRQGLHMNLLDYHDEEGDLIVLKLGKEVAGFGSRYSGKYIREKCLYLLSSVPGRPLILDWEGVPLISSSFADEAMGKLFVELGPLEFGTRIRHRALEHINIGLINKAILQRTTQRVIEQRTSTQQTRGPWRRRRGRH